MFTGCDRSVAFVGFVSKRASLMFSSQREREKRERETLQKCRAFSLSFLLSRELRNATKIGREMHANRRKGQTTKQFFVNLSTRVFFFPSFRLSFPHTCPALCLKTLHKKVISKKMQACQSITARRASFSLAAHAHKAVKKQRVSSSVVRAAQEIIATDAAPKAVGPYSQGIKVRRTMT